MNNVLSPKLIEFANKVSKIPGLKILLKPVYYKYKDNIRMKRNKAFRDNALSVLNDFDKAMKKSGINYSLAFGTLLGAVREKGFIRHDLDIDVFLWIEDYSEKINEILVQSGFVKDHIYLVNEGKLGREETYIKNDVSIDLFYIYPPIRTLQYTCDFIPLNDVQTPQLSMKKHGRVLARRIEIPVSKKSQECIFEGIRLPIPINYDEFLKFRYGEDYMIPNPHWVNGSNQYTIEWPEVHAIFQEIL